MIRLERLREGARMGGVVAAAPSPFLCGVSGGACIVAFALGLLLQAARAEDCSPELIQPAVCSPVKPVPPELKGICEVTALGGKRNEVKLNLTATTDVINVGGYRVETENYNGAYLSPVIEAMPGDTVAAHLENRLKPRPVKDPQTMAHGAAGENPTNLHYFHGGIVTPNNARPPIDASKGNGDNIYVRLKNGVDGAGKPNSFDYNVPIPGEKDGKGELDARVLEGEGWISHPDGLNWYHSHMHGISSDQVMGGLAGLLSVGEDKANVRAKCDKPPNPEKCDKDTADLKKSTIVRYAVLQDISLANISALPEDAGQDKTALWAPRERDSFDPVCPVGPADPKLRKGFCQLAQKSAWLFTLNGQRFPTITVGDNQNLLLRIGNLSANVAYWLELCKENTPCKTGETLPLTVLSLDGVVPASPVDPGHAKIPVDAFDVNDLLLMPASRAEIYVRNDKDPPHSDEQVYILRTKGLDAGSDQWPEIQLARVVLKPAIAVSRIALALNAPIEQKFPGPSGKKMLAVPPPEGCVRDLGEGEHRRVTFVEGETVGPDTHWSIATEIMHPPAGSVPSGGFDESKFEPDKQATIGTYDGDELKGIPFEDYVKDGSIDWLKPHVCIRLDHIGSHQQLWVLRNPTSGLHNFHIHQMKFRLATRKELEVKYHINPPKESHTCPDKTCSQPDYKFYEEDSKSGTGESQPVWHDTMPVPNGPGVFLIMSFDAKEQIGRYVIHCHILKHEDNGLMAPIEVWDPRAGR